MDYDTDEISDEEVSTGKDNSPSQQADYDSYDSSEEELSTGKDNSPSLQADYDSDESDEEEVSPGKDNKDHHNDLERKRRNVYKENVKKMIKCIPELQGKVCVCACVL